MRRVLNVPGLRRKKKPDVGIAANGIDVSIDGTAGDDDAAERKRGGSVEEDEDDDEDGSDLVQEERDLLLRALVEMLPAHEVASLTERHLGHSVERAAQLSTLQLRTLPAVDVVHAARLSRQQQQQQQQHAYGPNQHVSRLRHQQHTQAHAGSTAGSGGARHEAVTDLDSLQQHAGPTFTMPGLAMTRMPSLGNTRMGAFPTSPRSPGGVHADLSLMRGGSSLLPMDGSILPPLPVPLAELHPSLLHEPPAAQLSLAAFELLVSASERLGAGVRVAEVVAGSPAALGGLAPGDILYTCNGALLLGLSHSGSVLRAACEGRSGRARLVLTDGRELYLSARAHATSGKPTPASPFGLVTEALSRPGEAHQHDAGAPNHPRDHPRERFGRERGSSSSSISGGGEGGSGRADGRTAETRLGTITESARRADETLSSIRTRLNIPLRQLRWLLQQ